MPGFSNLNKLSSVYSGPSTLATPAIGYVPTAGLNRLLKGPLLEDIAPPVISNPSPTPGTSVAAGASVSVDITDTSGALGSVFAYVALAVGPLEVAYTGVGFPTGYAGSSQLTITNGKRLTFVRADGWVGTFSLTIVAYDAQGNSASQTYSWVGPATSVSAPATSSYQFSSSLLLTEGVDYGFDVLVFPDLDASFNLTNDSRVLAEALARRLLTPRGRLDFHPNYGLDIRDFLNAEITNDSLFRLQASAEAECEQDERVLSATVRATYDAAAEKLSLSISVDASSGPFKFVLAVTALTVELLASQD